MSLIVDYECVRFTHHPPQVIGPIKWTIEWADPAPGIDLAVNCPICRQLCQIKHFKPRPVQKKSGHELTVTIQSDSPITEWRVDTK